MNTFDESIRHFCWGLARLGSHDHKLALHFAHTALQQRKAAARRRRAAAGGVPVPPLMIMSVTRRCNLRCAGCFVHEHGRPAGDEMTIAELRTVLTDARDLGVSMIALAGGEPLTRPEILDLAGEFPEMLFPLVTNGSLLDDAVLTKLRALPNIVPVISLEGLEFETDSRRGGGVYQRALQTMARLQERHILFGTSLMVTRRNFGLVTGRAFVRDIVGRGAKLLFYVDYVPIKPGTEDLVPSEKQRQVEPLAMAVLEKEFRALFVAASASEAAYGGCMAAGRGFAHVSPEGDLEPCPFSPFSDTNLRRVPLRVALLSRLLKNIRESGEHLSEDAGGCALWAKRDWVKSMMETDGAALAGDGAQIAAEVSPSDVAPCRGDEPSDAPPCASGRIALGTPGAPETRKAA